MSLLDETFLAIKPVSEEAARRMQKRLDEKTKPRGSLGVLESLACRIAAMHGHDDLRLSEKAIVVMAGDHGVAEEGVSAYPSEVTAQMLANFAQGGAAINVIARQAGARVVVVDLGTRKKEWEEGEGGEREKPLRHALPPSSWLGSGTANFTRGPAMTVAQAIQGVEVGIQIVSELCDTGTTLIGVGEMGIGNSTAASALTAVMTGEKPERVTGRGAGIDDGIWKHKMSVVEKALAVNQPSRDRPLEALAKVGGFEIAGLVGVTLGAAARRVPVVLDGFITGAAALVAVGLCPAVRQYLIASHQSVEPGHRHVLEHLELRPLFNLDLRLGEGTGAALAMHLVEAAVRIAREMATFASAGVSTEK